MKNELTEMRHLRELIASHTAELERLRAVNDLRSSLANAGSGGGGGDHVGAAILRAEKRVDLEAKILRELDAMLGIWNRVHDAIEAVDDNDERLVLRMRYINEDSIGEIARTLHLSTRQTWRIHDTGVKKLKDGTECH